MSRTSPTVALQYVDKETMMQEQILDSMGLWVVTYDGKPFNIKVQSYLSDSPIKYKKVAYPNPGHAINLCNKLNKRYKTDKFAVVKLL
jgi:hypothetical protein